MVTGKMNFYAYRPNAVYGMMVSISLASLYVKGSFLPVCYLLLFFGREGAVAVPDCLWGF
jgi:hypothetical protein